MGKNKGIRILEWFYSLSFAIFATIMFTLLLMYFLGPRPWPRVYWCGVRNLRQPTVLVISTAGLVYGNNLGKTDDKLDDFGL